MHQELEILSFETQDADPVDARGVLWGGNLAMVASLIGTPYMPKIRRSEEHTSELQSLMRISYAVFCLKKKTTQKITNNTTTPQKLNNNKSLLYKRDHINL